MDRDGRKNAMDVLVKYESLSLISYIILFDLQCAFTQHLLI